MSGTEPNSEQAEFWSDGGGLNWIQFESQLEQLFGNITQSLMDTAALTDGDQVLDIGCGTGGTTRQAAALVGPKGHATGIDISTSMLARAAEQALPNTTFTRADAQTEPLPAAHYAHLISRFGVMFFENPVAAFQNLRTSLKPSGTLTFAAWAPFKENPWFTIPRRAATDLLGSPPPFDPRAAGPFAFADTAYTLSILQDAGFTNTAIETRDIPLVLPGSVENAANLSAYIGPADSVIRAQGGTARDKAEIVAATQTALMAFATKTTVTVPAKIHIYTAQT